jgi:hypothetical protein
MMKVDGYGSTAEFDGHTLTLTATNRASRVTLHGLDSKGTDRAVIPVESITSVRLKDAGGWTNGNLIIRTNEGRKYQTHFRKKQGEGFAELAAALDPT